MHLSCAAAQCNDAALQTCVPEQELMFIKQLDASASTYLYDQIGSIIFLYTYC